MVHFHILRAGHNGVAADGLPGALAKERQVVSDAHRAIPVQAAIVDVPVLARIKVVAIAQPCSRELKAVGEADVVVFPRGEQTAGGQ